MKVPVFDFLGYFETMLQQYLRGSSRKPMAHFLVGFGQKLISNNTDLSGLLISAQVYHSRAKYRLNQVSVYLLTIVLLISSMTLFLFKLIVTECKD